jgi:hypothetical protein
MSSTSAPSIAGSPRGPRASPVPPASPAHSALSAASPAINTAVRDSALMRYVHEKQPFNAAHGTKGAAWEAVSRAMLASTGVSWQGVMCRSRATFLLEKYDRQRAGRGVSKFITALEPDVLPILEQQLLLVAKTRDEAKLKSLVTASAVQKAREEKKADRARQLDAKTKALMKERDEKRAAAVVARARETAAVNTATVVAKRRKRKGVKTKEQKRAASAAMFDALQHSREEYLNQLRVQTAAEAAAEATRLDGATDPATKPVRKASADLDLSLLRAVAKCSPFSQETKQSTETQWAAVAERVMKYCNLKFTTTALRDRCEALIKDFEANDCKKSTFTSGIVVADEERLGLLRVIRKEHDRQVRQSASDRVGKAPETASHVAQNDLAIEIEDEQDDEEQEEEDDDVSELHQDDLEQWGSLEENRVEGDVDQADEHAEESFVDDTQDDEEPEPSAQREHQREASEVQEHEHDYASVVLRGSSQATSAQSVRKRRRSEDADPAVGMNIDNLQVDDNSLDGSGSQDFTPRMRKHQRHQELEQKDETEANDSTVGLVEESRAGRRREPSSSLLDSGSDQVHTVVELIQAERQERRVEFKALLDLMKKQTDDHRSEWEREHEHRSREQTDRQREMSALVGLLSKERRDRKSEMLTMLEAMNKDRDDRREELKAMMALMTKLAENRSTS